MTDQEAIKWIDGRILELSCLVDITSSDKKMQRINEEYNALLVAKAAIEKRIPMKPLLSIEIHNKIWRTETHQCVVCMTPFFIQTHIIRPDGSFKRFQSGRRVPFCPVCGQAQKWKEK